MSDGRTQRWQGERWLFVLILLAAAGFRWILLEQTPPGLTHDEANNVADAGRILDGEFPFYFPVAQGKEPLYPYSVAAGMALLGRQRWVMRFVSGLWGLAQVLFVYLWARRAINRRVALLAAAGLAVSFWPVATARLGLRAIALPALWAAFAVVLWRRPGKSFAAALPLPDLLLAGVLLGATLYTYLAARIMPAVLLGFALYLLLVQRVSWKQNRWRLLALAGVAALVAAPLFLYLGQHPSAEIRLGQLDRPLRALLAGDPSLLVDRAWQALQMFFIRGDTFIPYNIPGKPLFGPLMALLFVGGLLMALWRWREPVYTFALLWLGVGFIPALATGVEAANLRAMGAQPVLYLFPALAIDFLVQRIQRNSWGGARTKRLVIWSATALLFVGLAAGTARDFFVIWTENPDVRVHYHVDLMAIADVAAESPAEMLAVSALYPGEYHDPQVVTAEIGERAGRVRWFDGRQALLLPSAGGAQLVVPSTVPVANALSEVLANNWEYPNEVRLHDDDFTSSLQIWQAIDPDPAGLAAETEPLAQLGGVVELTGIEGIPERVPPGSEVTVLTFWQVVGTLPADRDGVFFAQLLDQESQVVAQDDRLDVPSWGWQVGDRFVQVLRLAVPPELSAGRYRLILGGYTLPDRVDAVLAGEEPDPATPRLPVSIGGEPAGDYLELTLVVGDG